MQKSDAIYIVAMVVGAIISVVGSSFIGFMIVFISFIFLMLNMLITKRYKSKWLIILAIVFASIAVVMQAAAQIVTMK